MEIIRGNPNPKYNSTFYVERQNWQCGLHISPGHPLDEGVFQEAGEPDGGCRAALRLYNLVRVHQTLRVTPAVEAGITTRVWSIADIMALPDAADRKQRK